MNEVEATTEAADARSCISSSGGAEPRAIREVAPRGAAARGKIAGASGLRNFFYRVVFAVVGVFFGFAISPVFKTDEALGYLIGVGVGFALAIVADLLGGRAERAAVAWLEAHGEVLYLNEWFDLNSEGFEARVEAERRIRLAYADEAVAKLNRADVIVYLDGEEPSHWQVTGQLPEDVVDEEEWSAYEARVWARAVGIPSEAIPSGVWILDWNAAEKRIANIRELHTLGAAGAIARMLPEYEMMPESDCFEWLLAQYDTNRRPVLQWALLDEANRYAAKAENKSPNPFLNDGFLVALAEREAPYSAKTTAPRRAIVEREPVDAAVAEKRTAFLDRRQTDAVTAGERRVTPRRIVKRGDDGEAAD